MTPELTTNKSRWRYATAGAALLAGSAMAQTVPPVTPEQHFPPGYLESVATGYDHGESMPGTEIDKLSKASPAPAGTFVKTSTAVNAVTQVPPHGKKNKK